MPRLIFDQGYGLADRLFDIAQVTAFFMVTERNGYTGGTGAGCAANAIRNFQARLAIRS